MTIIEDMPAKAGTVANFLKGLANQQRLLILCSLSEGEKSVTDLIQKTGIAQTSMSQHLLKLKEEGIVTYRRDHRTLFYTIDHPAVAELMAVLYNHFCRNNQNDEQ